jgi:hypothetical protein
MDEQAIMRKMAEKWREVAAQVPHPALRKCYVERAASYERLASRSNGHDEPPLIVPSASPGDV